MAYLDANGITTLTQTYDSRYLKDVNQDGIVPVSKGGTGANTAAGALSNLGAAAANHTHSQYVNQNAFSNVVVGSTTLAADTTTDTLTITAGSNVTLTPTASSDSFSIAASDTLKSAASGKSDGSYLVNVASGAASLSAYTAPTVPVTSVNGETGAVVLDASDIMNGQYSVAADIEELQENLGDATALAYRNSDLYVATCSTAAGTAAKVATVINSQGFTLTTGAMVLVLFRNANSAAVPTLNVNSTGARGIFAPDALTSAESVLINQWSVHEAVLFVYDGNQWLNMGCGTAINRAYATANAAMPKTGGTFTGAPKYASDPADDNTLTRKSYVDSAIASALTASMVYKGTIGTGGTVTALPASATVGDVYMVKTAGTWAGKTCEAGDMLICNTTYTTVSNAYWDVVQANLTTLTDAEIIAAVAAA